MGRDSVIERVNENGVVEAYISFTNVIDGFTSPRIEVCFNLSLSGNVRMKIYKESNYLQTGEVSLRRWSDLFSSDCRVSFNLSKSLYLIDDEQFLLLSSGYYEISADASSRTLTFDGRFSCKFKVRKDFSKRFLSMCTTWVTNTH